jgi:hypothetical protein
LTPPNNAFRARNGAGASISLTDVVVGWRQDEGPQLAAELGAEILAHVCALEAQPLDEPGVSPIVAAQLIVAWSRRGRVGSEAAFARPAAGAALPASSEQTNRHQLSRSGDRQLNHALDTRHPPATATRARN